MKRRVIRHGASYIVSLPSKWVKKFNVERGDEIEIQENNKTLILSPEIVRSNISISKNVTGLAPRLVDRFLARAYQKGYDEILLEHNNLEVLEVIRKKVHELIGYEIIEQNNKSCVIKSIASHIQLDFDNSLRKAFLLVKEMVQTCADAYQNNHKETLQNLYLRDFEVNRFCYFCLRQINKDQYMEQEHAQQSHVLYYLIEILEDLGDCYKKLAQVLATTDGKNKQLLKLLKDLKDLYEISYTYFYKASKEKANQAYALFQDITKTIEACGNENKLKEGEIQALIHLSEAAGIIYHFTTMRLDYLE